MTICASILPAAATSQRWEAIVIGAGPAGAFAALRLARSGRRVLLVEKKSFPRNKVCGGCIGANAMRLLTDAGLAAQLHALPHFTAERLQLHAGGRTARIPIPSVNVIARADFDACLVRAAIEAGTHFLPNTIAVVDECDDQQRRVSCRHPEAGDFKLTTELVIVADGLSHSSVSRVAGLHDRVARTSRVGLGSIVAEDDGWCSTAGIPRDAIQMVVGRQGYVGLARSQSGQVHVAAAINPATLADRSRPTAVIAEILDDAGQHAWAERARTSWSDNAWSGTPPLTHRLHRMSTERLFVIGDAAAYVEPFTGEGITWALLAADNLTSMLSDFRPWTIRALQLHWQAEYKRSLRRKSRVCRVLASILRFPRLAAWSIRCLDTFPSCTPLLVRLLNGPLEDSGQTSI